MLEVVGLIGVVLPAAVALVLVARAVLSRQAGDAADAQRLTLLAAAMWIVIIAASVATKPDESVIERLAAGAGGLAAIISGTRFRWVSPRESIVRPQSARRDVSMGLIASAKLLYRLARAATIMLCGRGLIIGDAALHHGPFWLHPWSVEMRSGRMKGFRSYIVLIGHIDTPFHVPLRLEETPGGDAVRGLRQVDPVRAALSARGVVSVGEIPIGRTGRDELLDHIRRERALFDQMSTEFDGQLPPAVAARLSVGEIGREEAARQRARDRLARERRVIDDAVRELEVGRAQE